VENAILHPTTPSKTSSSAVSNIVLSGAGTGSRCTAEVAAVTAVTAEAHSLQHYGDRFHAGMVSRYALPESRPSMVSP
jgi:hypothetical protein